METDKRAIREKIVILTREISLLGMQREQHRKSRCRTMTLSVHKADFPLC